MKKNYEAAVDSEGVVLFLRSGETSAATSAWRNHAVVACVLQQYKDFRISYFSYLWSTLLPGMHPYACIQCVSMSSIVLLSVLLKRL